MSQNTNVHRDAFWLLCDWSIGRGMSREVFTSEVLKDCVVKVEDSCGHFQNVLEWETWNRIKWTDYAKWFAPCEYISPNGTILVMKKTLPAQDKMYPKQMPIFFSDFKRTNYGLFNGKLVCHDYGTSLLFENGMSKRMKKVEWWDS
jgi:hypothetical protein